MTYGDYPDLNGVKKILVIKLRQLGDVLLTGPVFTVLKNRFPNAKIDAYVYREAKDLLDGHPGIDHFITYERNWKKTFILKKFFKEIQIWWKIRRAKYDVVINLTEGDRGALAAKAAKAKVRVGFTPKGRFQKSLYTHIVKHCPTLRHTVERNLDALRRIGIFPKMDERDLFLPKEGKACIQEDFVLIHPGARWRFKSWSEENMRALTIALLERGKNVVFTSGPEKQEVEMVRRITEGLKVTNLSGTLTLKELASLIDRSEMLICVDSLVFHMASALKAKVVALFGPTSEVTWGPWRNPNARVVTQNMSCRPCYMDGCGGSKMSDCLQTLSVQTVLGAIDEPSTL